MKVADELGVKLLLTKCRSSSCLVRLEEDWFGTAEVLIPTTDYKLVELAATGGFEVGQCQQNQKGAKKFIDGRSTNVS